jgi:hypothetical protein
MTVAWEKLSAEVGSGCNLTPVVGSNLSDSLEQQDLHNQKYTVTHGAL